MGLEIHVTPYARNRYAFLASHLAAASTMDPETRQQEKVKGKIENAKQVGKVIADRAKARGIDRVVFDRNGFLYHGRVRALATAAREAQPDGPVGAAWTSRDDLSRWLYYSL